MEEKLNATSRELAAIKQALDEAAIVAITDKAGTITHVNDKFCRISKYAREELIGKNHRIIKSEHHPREFFIHLWHTIAQGKVWEGEICNRAKDGALYWVNTCIVPFLDETNRPYQYVSIRYEITQQKEAEAKLVSYAKRLEQSNEELEHFASIAAHDLQEPLRKIRAFADRLSTKFKDLIPLDGQSYLQRIQSAASRMQNLIDDLLTYSRVRLKANPYVDVDLNQILEGISSDLEVAIEQTNAKIEISPLPIVRADKVQMYQLFLNLLSNALKFIKPGHPCAISITSNIEDGICTIKIKDNGIGFEEKYLDRIFNIFQRLHGRVDYPGTGVGLAVCRRIVELHQGTITALGIPDEGATFIVTLPLTQKREN
jgi:PAS domain S-box-containing protein